MMVNRISYLKYERCGNRVLQEYYYVCITEEECCKKLKYRVEVAIDGSWCR